ASHSAPLPPPTPTLSPYTTLFRSKKPNTAYPPVSHPHPGKSARSASPVSLDPVSGAMLAQWPGRYPPPTPSDRSTQPNPRSAHPRPHPEPDNSTSPHDPPAPRTSAAARHAPPGPARPTTTPTTPPSGAAPDHWRATGAPHGGAPRRKHEPRWSGGGR